MQQHTARVPLIAHCYIKPVQSLYKFSFQNVCSFFEFFIAIFKNISASIVMEKTKTPERKRYSLRVEPYTVWFLLRSQNSLENSIFLFLSICVHVCRLVHMCVHMDVKARGQPWVFFLKTLATTFFETGSLTGFELTTFCLPVSDSSTFR